MKFCYKYLFVLFFFSLLLQSCTASYVKNAKEVNDFQHENKYLNSVTICSGIFTKQEEIDNYAQYMCLLTNQKSEFVSQTRLSGCSVVKSVATKYNCLQN